MNNVNILCQPFLNWFIFSIKLDLILLLNYYNNDFFKTIFKSSKSNNNNKLFYVKMMKIIEWYNLFIFLFSFFVLKFIVCSYYTELQKLFYNFFSDFKTIYIIFCSFLLDLKLYATERVFFKLPFKINIYQKTHERVNHR